MTIDEAIKHCEEVTEEQERKAQCMGRQFVGTTIANYQNACIECAADHRQLAEWLRELKELRCLKSDYDIFRAEAKRLLKLAVEDIKDNVTCSTMGWRYADEAMKLIEMRED